MLEQSLLDRVNEWPFNAFALDRATGGKSHTYTTFLLIFQFLFLFLLFIYFFSSTSLGRPLPTLCFHLFHHYGLMAHFSLDPVKAWKFFSQFHSFIIISLLASCSAASSCFFTAMNSWRSLFAICETIRSGGRGIPQQQSLPQCHPRRRCHSSHALFPPRAQGSSNSIPDLFRQGWIHNRCRCDWTCRRWRWPLHWLRPWPMIWIIRVLTSLS